MQIKKLKLLPINLSLKQPFASAHETMRQRPVTLVALGDELGNWGYGEIEAFATPFYTAETQVTSCYILQNFLWPLIKEQEYSDPRQLWQMMQAVKANHFAKAAIDMAVWDLTAKRLHQSLAALLAEVSGITGRQQVPVGVSVGLHDLPQTVQAVRKAQIAGYSRIKIKVNGNQDLQRIAQLRQQLPDFNLTLDANGSLTMTPTLAPEIDRLHLTFIEDPFSPVAWGQSWQLQSEMQTPLCFDEPIVDVKMALDAMQLEQCQIVSVKLAVLGGLTPVLQLLQAQQQQHFLMWCGGMLEGGIGRAANLALASLSNFNFPGDLSANARYYDQDYTESLTFAHGQLLVPDAWGLGVELLPKYQTLLAQQPILD
ncbi:o-succinylbenzoate synthase [Bombilactobacillus folatiphilus]|uniref:o-succinylbenzoate synthase n=1 Tax=Bombilactobacillus folatiphilus TaxID=2923362 RepID=A0ABY4P7X2_9LACO|nr:o-succinylbenzoate synthase [Bombilactobacillus folatiphilus]UQS81798.1 o-succinylbenzoate synthase [Bombilactobacillus folatiphilus]